MDKILEKLGDVSMYALRVAGTTVVVLATVFVVDVLTSKNTSTEEKNGGE
jgi:hypothetical protein